MPADWRARLRDPGSAPAAAIRGIATTFMQALAGVALARALSPDARGRVAVVVAASTLVAMTGSLGLELGVRFRFVELVGAYGNGGALRVFHAASRRARLITAILALSIGVGYAAAVDWFDILIVAGMTLTSLTLLESNLRRGLLRATGNTTAGAGSELVGASLTLVGYFGLLIGTEDAGVLPPLAILIGASLAAAASAAHYSPAIPSRRGGIRSKARHDLIMSSLKAHFGTLAMAVAYRADRMILALIVPSAAIGRYAIAVSLAELVALVPTTVSHVVMARSALGTASSRSAIAFSMGASVVAAAVIWITSPVVIPAVFGDSYAGAVDFIPPLIGAAMVQSLWRLRVSAIVGRGETRSFALSAALAAAILVSLTWILGAKVGAVGAAWASLAAYVGALAVLMARK